MRLAGRPGGGVIGGAVVYAARRTARLSRGSLGELLGTGAAEVRAREHGMVPLRGVPYGQLRQFATAVTVTGSGAAAVLDELLIAGQCDLLVREMLTGSADYAEVPTVGEDSRHGHVARELLAWAFQGTVPSRYRRVTRPGRIWPGTRISSRSW